MSRASSPHRAPSRPVVARGLGGALLSLTLLAPPSPAPAAECGTAADGVVLLCGKNTVTSTGSGAVRVRVPQETTIYAPAYLDIPGFPQPPPRAAPVSAVLIAEDALDGRWWFNAEFSREYASYYYEAEQDTLDSRDGRPVLPPGDYTLYFVTAPGTTASMTVYLDDLAGVSTVTPGRTVDVDYAVLPSMSPAADAQKVVFSSGQSYDFDRPSVGFYSANMKDAGVPAAGVYPGSLQTSICALAPAPQDETLAYAPGCPSTITEDADGLWLLISDVAMIAGLVDERLPHWLAGEDQNSLGFGSWWLNGPRVQRMTSLAFQLYF